MTAEQKEAVKRNLEDYVRRITKPGKNKGFYICPFCGSGTGKNQTGAFRLSRENTHFHCFSCGRQGDIFDLIGWQEGISDKGEVFRRAEALFPGVSPARPSQPTPVQESAPAFSAAGYLAFCREHAGDTDYFSRRGLSPQTVAAYGLGYDPKQRLAVLPYGGDGDYYISRSVDEKRYLKPRADFAGPEPVFQEPLLLEKSGEPLFVTEGPFDCLSFLECGAAAVSLGGTGYRKLVEFLKKRPPARPLVLCLDQDGPGKENQSRLKEALAAEGISSFDCPSLGTFKDPGEALVGDRDFFQSVIAQAGALVKSAAGKEGEEYRSSSALGYLPAFLEEIRNNRWDTGIPTGFPRLDRALDGGLYEGLTILGAVSSLGKTTFLLQLADQIAQSGRDVLFITLEMPRRELLAKSVSRLTYLRGRSDRLAKTSRGVALGRRWGSYSQEERALLESCLEEYRSFAGRLYFREALGSLTAEDVRRMVEEHLRMTGNTPVVCLDYLQILAPLEPRATDKQNTDRAVFELKRLSRDFRLPVVAISSLNRDSYTSSISMRAFKESGAIEYSSDVLLGLQFAEVSRMEEEGEVSLSRLDACRKKDVREVELKILKNRGGPAGQTLSFSYRPRFNFFEEEEGKAPSSPRTRNPAR